MNTPSKEALEAAKTLFTGAFFPECEVAAIIDRHFSPLRKRLAEMESLLASEKTTRNAIIAKGEQTDARVKELEAACAELVTDGNAITLAANLAKQSKRVKDLEHGLKHQCETCEMKSVFDGEHDFAVKAQARVKELEAKLDALDPEITNANKVLDRQHTELTALRAANAELQKQEAESRRLFYAEQDKRQSVEFRCEELAGALQVITDLLSKTVKDFGWCDHSVGVCMCEEIRACDNANNVLARHAAGEPAGLRTEDPLTDGNTLGGLPRHVGDKLGDQAKHPGMSRHAQPFCGD